MEASPNTEYRPYSPDQLACLILLFRQFHGWSQETLAELSGLTVRTIQRVEAVEPSSLDTRRALARAFGLEDIDTFVRVHEMTTEAGAARAKADFERRFAVIEVEPADGRSIVRAIVNGGPYWAVHAGNVAIPPREVEDLYVRLVDFLRDILDVTDVVSSTEMLGYGDEIDGWLAEMRAFGWEVAMGSRQLPLTRGRLPTTVTYFMAFQVGCGTRQVAVPKDPMEQGSPAKGREIFFPKEGVGDLPQ